METITITTEMNSREAMALAQLCKRIGFSDCRTLSVNDAEAHEMISAILSLQESLAESGFAPR